MTTARSPRPPRIPRIRSDDSIGRQEDIGSLVPAEPAPQPDRSHGNGLPVRTKPVRVTLDLDPAAYKELNQWLGSAAAEVGAPVSKARALRAMIRAVSLDKSIGLVVIDLLRRD